MLPDLLPAAETLAKGVKHIACYVADAIAERRRAFDEDESGDYLRCAGADALAESLGRMESEGPDTADSWHWCAEHNMRTIRCVNMPHAEGDEWNDAAVVHHPRDWSHVVGGPYASAASPPSAAADDSAAEVSVCYFCDRPTDRTVVCTADFDTEYVCEKCAHIAQSPAAHGVAADGPAEACDILQSPSAGHPIPIERDPLYLALRIAEVAEGVPLTTLLTVAQVLINKGAQAVVASRVAEDAPQQIETGHDMGGRWAAETFPQHTKPPK